MRCLSSQVLHYERLDLRSVKNTRCDRCGGGA